MTGISRAERVILVLTAVFCGASLLCLSRSAEQVPSVEVTQHRPAPVEQVEEHHALLEGEHINLNQADIFDLQRLPGIGEKRAKDILAYREKNGGFRCLEELLLIPGIGEKTLEAIRRCADIG